MDETPIQQPTQPSQGKSSKNVMIAVVLIVVVLIVALYYGVLKNMKKEEVNTPTTAGTNDTTTNPIDTNNQTVTSSQLIYKDGTYSVVGNYVSPGGAESINVTVILKDDVITDATVIPNATRPISVQMQGKFISGFKSLVVGKNIDEVTLDKVSGSSLTPKGFNDAIAKIKVEAKA